MTKYTKGCASYKIEFTEDLSGVVGSPVVSNGSVHFMDVVKERNPQLHSDIIKFIEDFHDTNFLCRARVFNYL